MEENEAERLADEAFFALSTSAESMDPIITDDSDDDELSTPSSATATSVVNQVKRGRGKRNKKPKKARGLALARRNPEALTRPPAAGRDRPRMSGSAMASSASSSFDSEGVMASSVRREFESRVSRLAARLSASSSRMPLLHATGHLTQGAPWYLRRSRAVFRFAHTEFINVTKNMTVIGLIYLLVNFRGKITKLLHPEFISVTKKTRYYVHRVRYCPGSDSRTANLHHRIAGLMCDQCCRLGYEPTSQNCEGWSTNLHHRPIVGWCDNTCGHNNGCFADITDHSDTSGPCGHKRKTIFLARSHVSQKMAKREGKQFDSEF